MTITISKWLGFIWDLEGETPLTAAAPGSYVVEIAQAEDFEALRNVIDKSLSLDPGWNSSLHEISPWVERTAENVGTKEGAVCLALRHGSRIIGGAMLDPTASEPLSIGPCVLVEYRNRGLGTLLLAEALKHLRKAGLNRASTIIPEGSLAARFLYPKFGGKSQPAEPLLAA